MSLDPGGSAPSQFENGGSASFQFDRFFTGSDGSGVERDREVLDPRPFEQDDCRGGG